MEPEGAVQVGVRPREPSLDEARAHLEGARVEQQQVRVRARRQLALGRQLEERRGVRAAAAQRGRGIGRARAVPQPARAAEEGMLTLQSAAKAILERSVTAAPPSVAVVCLQYGSFRAAKKLSETGVKNVLWLTADMLSEGCKDILCKVVFQY